MKNIIFHGGTGQCKVMRPIAESLGYNVLGILDDTEDMLPPFSDIMFLNGPNCLEEFIKWKNKNKIKDLYFLVTIGNPYASARISISKKLESLKFIPASLVHNKSIVDSTASIGKACQIHASAIVNPSATVGDYCILNTGSIIEHDDFLSSGVEIGPGSTLCGNVSIGENTWVGAGATVRQDIIIGKNCIIGAGSVVIDNIPDNSIVVGVPARRFIK